MTPGMLATLVLDGAGRYALCSEHPESQLLEVTMPRLEVVSRSEAEFRTSGKARADAIREYIEFIDGLKGDQAGKLEAGGGETVRTVRHRLGECEIDYCGT